MDPSQLQPGYRLDRYELLCPLAYGGMASVWLARFGGRLGFERLVVVKMILPQYSQDPRFQEMFLDEARIASRIEHSNVARILDVGEHDENYFIVMEWVDGDSLSKVLRASEQRKQRVPPGIALKICADAAAGLHAAHVLHDRDGSHLGVVHRDVSPQNILISNAGATMLIDFGVAKARDRVSQETSAGQLKGKIRYMAPEQALGREIDHRADVWALGAMLYELFTGSPPYDGPNEVATLHKLTSGQAPTPLPKSVPQEVRAVIERALAYDPEERFGTALELNLALEGAMVLIGEPTSIAVVAHYTGQLLADRKSARKRAVDAALANAHARDAGGNASTGPVPAVASSPLQIGTPVGAIVAPPAPSAPSRISNPPSQTFPLLPPLGGHTNEPPSVPSQGSMGLHEVPSATSSATLGSANMEYPPNSIPPEDGVRRRRYVGAAILGVSLAAGVVGAVLIISTAVLKHGGVDPAPARALASPTETATPQPAATPTAPPIEATDLNPPSTAVTAPTNPPAPTGSVHAANDPKPDPKSDPKKETTPASGSQHKGGNSGNIAPAKPKPTPPAPTPAQSGGRVDRGF